MSNYVLIPVAISALVGWFVFRDLWVKQTGILLYSVERSARPLVYWLLIIMWMAILAFCLFITWAVATAPVAKCDEVGVCEITTTITRA